MSSTARHATTYTVTPGGDIVRRIWRDRTVYVAVLRPGAKRATLQGMVDSVPTTTPGACGYKAVGVRRALNNMADLGTHHNYVDAETMLLMHRSGRVSLEEWAPPARLARQATARVELARRRALMAVDGRGFSIADLVFDL